MMSGGGEGNDFLQPGQSIRPNVSEDLAKELVQKYYNFQVSRVKELNSYDDNNFFIEGTNTKTATTGKYILKVLNSIDSRKTGHIEAENAAMLFLSENGVNCPVPQRNNEGNTFAVVEIPGKETSGAAKHAIRLLSFVEGKILYDIGPNPKLLFKTGAYLARLDNLFKKYSHPALEAHSSNWQMVNSLELRKFMYVIENDAERYDLVKSVMDAFEQRVIPSFANLEKGVIHGDYNEQNVIVRPIGNNEEDGYEIHGIIDFGDLHISYYVFELAIMLCYMMLECVRVGGIDPFVGGGHLLAGYNTFRKVPQKELDVVRVCVAARLCQSLVMGAYTYSQNPGNEYLLITAKTGWKLLSRIWKETTDEQLQKAWKDTIDSYN